MEQAGQSRIEELERLISDMRHDLRGAMSPAALIADRLRQSEDPSQQRSGKTISAVVDRVLAILDASSKVVPQRGDTAAGPLLGGPASRTRA